MVTVWGSKRLFISSGLVTGTQSFYVRGLSDVDLSQTESGRKSFQVSQELFFVKDLRFVFKSVLSQEEVCNFLRVVRHNPVTQHVFSVSL